jgi:hypothetical protein
MNFSKKDSVSNSTTINSANKTYSYNSEHSAQIRKRQTNGAFDDKNKVCEKDTIKMRRR